MGVEDNFWLSGVIGFCGLCLEMYFDFYFEWGIDDVVWIWYFVDFLNGIFVFMFY